MPTENLKPQLGQYSLFEKYWTLCLLDGLSRNGLGPNSRSEIFSFAYLACAVASEFHNTSIQNSVLKNQSGPKILIVSRSIDRLIAGGMVEIYSSVNKVAAHPVEGQYLISNLGRATIEKSVKDSDYLRPIAEFLQNVTFAFGYLSPDEIGIASKADASFADTEVPGGEVIDLGEWQPGNKTTDMLGFLRDYSRKFFSEDPFVACQMYARYLNSKVSSFAANSSQGEFV